MNNKNDNNKSYLLLSHYATYAMQDLLFEYLSHKKTKFIKKINFPLPELPFLKKIEIENVVRGQRISESKIKSIYKPASIAYLYHIIQTISIILFDKNKYDVIIAQDSILGLSAIILKYLNKCEKVIYYCHGFYQDRFKNPLRWFYRNLDYFVAISSDANWLLSKKMLRIRRLQKIDNKKLSLVPATVPLNSLKRNTKPRNKKLIFIGTLNQMNGVLLLPEIISLLKINNINIHLDIIGDGPDKTKLVQMIKQKILQQNITLLGLKSFKEYSNSLTNYYLGVAPYSPSEDNLLQTTDPMKLRLYQAAGLPVVTTKGFPFSNEIVKNDIGSICEYNIMDFSKCIQTLFENSELNQKYRTNALQYSMKFDLNNIFKNSLNKI